MSITIKWAIIWRRYGVFDKNQMADVLYLQVPDESIVCA